MKAYPYLLRENASGRQLTALGAEDAPFDESWLQEVLRRHPQILPVAEIEVVFAPMISIGREVAVTGGAIDNLYISSRGYLTIVETKLWRNPEARRTVVAQVMDYTNALSKWTYDDLDSSVKEYARKYENKAYDLVSLVERDFDSIEGGADFFVETVEKNLRLGRLLALIVGDRIRESAIEMASFVNRQPGLALNLALVELQCFKQKEDSTWPLLLVPQVVKRTEIVERSVVQVTVTEGKPVQIEIEQDRIDNQQEAGTRSRLTEEAFWELFRRRAGTDYQIARGLIEKYRDRAGVGVYPRENSLAVRFDMHDSGLLISLFFLTTTARLVVWPHTIADQIEKAGYDTGLVEDYRNSVGREFRAPSSRKEFGVRLGAVNVQRFSQAVDSFLAALEQATPVE